MLLGGMEGLYAVDVLSGCMAFPILQRRLIRAAVCLGGCLSSVAS